MNNKQFFAHKQLILHKKFGIHKQLTLPNKLKLHKQSTIYLSARNQSVRLRNSIKWKAQRTRLLDYRCVPLRSFYIFIKFKKIALRIIVFDELNLDTTYVRAFPWRALRANRSKAVIEDESEFNGEAGL